MTGQNKVAPENSIERTRGVFKFLPYYFSNDLVFGSWLFVYGSAFSTIIPVFPLIDIYFPLFHEPNNSELRALSQVLTWVLLILSGAFFTVGSLVFVRAFEIPRKPPLLKIKYADTDEVVAAWLYLFGAIPSLPYVLVYCAENPRATLYWAGFVMSFLFVVASVLFVYVSFPSANEASGGLNNSTNHL